MVCASCRHFADDNRCVCLFQRLELRAGGNTVLRRLETFTFFLAMMLAIILEGGFVYWVCRSPFLLANHDKTLNVAGEWTGFALPQGWLLGALLVLIYRLTAIFIPPTSWTTDEIQRNRRAFVRLWCLAMAVAAMQGLLFLLGPRSA